MSIQPAETRWYCVLRIFDFRMLYLGSDCEAARAAALPGTHMEIGSSRGDAQRLAAIEVGKLQQAKIKTHLVVK
jgi:hypothetical protein